ncbi:RHS repeat-associated core domain-containing protein [Actinoplanes sp. DH11]|uniref:RHS repeat-associated core domain-containing protein n=1 Tax=Actinoplanes sp. DH11 TaxID=2857011 RepID=UPI001E2C6641|nr:RHS repeat-associated core domain-containing protein [Actinoplanes sp. DH11]
MPEDHFTLPRSWRRRGLALAAAVLVALAPVPVRAAPAVAAAPGTPPAPQGPGSPERPLPVSALPNKGLPVGERPPVEPPSTEAAGMARKLTATQFAAAGAPAKRARQVVGRAAESAVRGADALVLRSGYATGDTSLVVYFSLADTAITSWSATVYDAASQRAQESVTLGKGDLPVCGSPRQFCRGFGGAEGWALDAGHDYFVKITVSYPDGSTQTSASSNNARPRTLGETPAIPAAQAAGCACANALGRSTSGQQVRGRGVNTGTGAFTRIESDLGMASFAVPFQLGRVYSSANTSSGLFGNGWASTLDLKVTATDTGATVRAEDGAQADYKRSDDGSYRRPAGVRSDLKKTEAGWELTTPEQVTHRFDGSGRYLSAKNKRGHGFTLNYTGSALMSVTDAAGRKVAIEYRQDLGFVTKVTLPDGRFTNYDYEGGRLRSFQSAINQTTQYRYDNGRLREVINSRGLAEVTNTYDATTGRVSEQRDINGKVTTVEWDAGKQEAKVTDPDGVVNFDGYAGNLVKYTQNGNGDTSSQRYDAQANPNLNVDGNNNQRESTFDGAGNMASSKAPEPFGFTEKAEFTPGNKPKTYTDGNGVTWTAEYNDFHEMTKRTNGEGRSYTYEYDGRGLRTSMTDPRDKTSRYEYDSAGNLTAEITPTGRRTEYTYDSAGRLKTVIDPRGTASGANRAAFTTAYSYDNEDRQTLVQQPGKGKPWETRYDEGGRTKTVVDPLSRATIYDYDRADRLETVRSPRGDVTTYAYTAAGRLQSQSNGEGDKTSYAYSKKGLLEKLVTARGNEPGADPAQYTWTFHYDGNGNPVRRTHPNPGGGEVSRDTGWDELDRAVTDTDPLGAQSSASYDNNSNVTSIDDPAKARTGFTYDKNNRPTDVTDSQQGKTHTDYDAAGNPEKITSATGGVTSFAYDGDNRRTSQVEPRGNAEGANADDYRTRFGYDRAGNLTSTTDPLGNVTEASYDAINRVTTRTDANKRVTRYGYDDADQLKTVLAPDATGGQATSYSYDANGAVTEVRDPLQHTRTAFYDKAGRVIATTDALGRYREHVYDAEGHVVETVIARTVADPRNPGRDPERDKHTITDTYDTLGRRTQTKLGTTGPVYTFGYNAKDELTSANDPAGSQSYAYDTNGRVEQIKRGDRVFDYGYDGNGNVTSRTFPDGTAITADYDADNRIKELTAAGDSWTFSYDPAGRRTSVDLPADGLVERLDYDRAGRLTGIETGTVGKYALDLDPVGNPKKITTTRGGISEQVAYRHDPADRLTDACYGTASCDSAGTGKISYTYDLVGNRKSQTRSGAAGNSATTYRYDDVDQLISETTTGASAGTKAYKYDSEGNRTDDGADRYEYHLDHTLLSATVGGQKTTYAYSATGQRLTATTGASTRTWDWDLNGSLPQIAVDSAGSDARTFVHNVTGEPLALRDGGAASIYVHDWLGGTSALVSGNGGVQAVYDYDPYGLPRTSPTEAGVDITATDAATANPLKFTGQYQDATAGGDYFMRARMYDPGTGSFTGVDPVKAGIGEPAMSPYAYVDGQVLLSVDPTGESLTDWLSDAGDKISEALDKSEEVEEDIQSEATEWTEEIVTGALKTYENLDDASATSVGTPKSKKKAAQNDLKQAYQPKNIINGFKAGYEEDSGNPVRQVTRGVLDVGSMLVGGASAVKAARGGATKAPRATSGAENVNAAVGLRNSLTTAQAANPLMDSLRATGRLPSNYVTKTQAQAAGWEPGKALGNKVPGGQIGGDPFRNTTGVVPAAPGRSWFEADVGLVGNMSRAKQPGTRLVYSDDGLAYVTYNHYETVYQLPNWK